MANQKRYKNNGNGMKLIIRKNCCRLIKYNPMWKTSKRSQTSYSNEEMLCFLNILCVIIIFRELYMKKKKNSVTSKNRVWNIKFNFLNIRLYISLSSILILAFLGEVYFFQLYNISLLYFYKMLIRLNISEVCPFI